MFSGPAKATGPYKDLTDYLGADDDMQRASQVGQVVVKNPPANAGDMRQGRSVPELGRSPGGGHGNPLRYSCLENPMDRGAWRALLVHRVIPSQIGLKLLSTHTKLIC